MKKQNYIIWIYIIILISIEQFIKIIINNNFLQNKFTIIPQLFYFHPTFNRDYSWLNSMLKLGVSRWIHIALVIVLSIYILFIFIFINKKLGPQKIMNALFAFAFSGSMCSLIDKVLWNGSLDYIELKGYFVFDLKDLYIDIFIGILLIALIFKNKVLARIDNDLMKDFIKFIKFKF